MTTGRINQVAAEAAAAAVASSDELAAELAQQLLLGKTDTADSHIIIVTSFVLTTNRTECGCRQLLIAGQLPTSWSDHQQD